MEQQKVDKCLGKLGILTTGVAAQIAVPACTMLALVIGGVAQSSYMPECTKGVESSDSLVELYSEKLPECLLAANPKTPQREIDLIKWLGEDLKGVSINFEEGVKYRREALEIASRERGRSPQYKTIVTWWLAFIGLGVLWTSWIMAFQGDED